MIRGCCILASRVRSRARQRGIWMNKIAPADLMRSAGAYCCDQVCKPGSVFCSHLSRPSVAAGFKPPPRDGRVGLMCPSTALLRIEFTASFRLRTMGELLPRLSTLTALLRRYISVALVLRSPSAGVTRYPCPMEPGLSSRTGFHLVPAAAWPGRRHHCTHSMNICQRFSAEGSHVFG